MTFPAPTHDTLAAKVARFRSPAFSYCLRCGMPWSKVKGHSTPYGGGHSCFPLCEGCWETLGHPEARIEYYGTLVAHWETHSTVDPEVRANIGRAVAAGR